VLKRSLVGLLLAAAGVVVHPSARADIFRCVGGGTTMYTDVPCPPGMRTADTITSAQAGGVERDEDALERGAAEREQLAIREAERRRVEQDLAARELALRRAEQELAIREEESYRRAEEDARLAASAWSGGVAPVVEPYPPVVSYPVVVVVVPWRPCVGARCFPDHRPHKPGDPQHHHPHPGAGDAHDKRAAGAPAPQRQDGRQFAKQ